MIQGQPISMNSPDSDFYKRSHGRKDANGQFSTYKDLQKTSFFSKISSCLYYTFLFVILAISISMIYIIDVNKGSEKDVVKAFINISEGSIQDVYQKTVEVGGEVVSSLIETVVVNVGNGKQWVSEGLGSAYEKVADNKEINGIISWIKNSTIWQKADRLIRGTTKEVVNESEKPHKNSHQSNQQSGVTTIETIETTIVK